MQFETRLKLVRLITGKQRRRRSPWCSICMRKKTHTESGSASSHLAVAANVEIKYFPLKFNNFDEAHCQTGVWVASVSRQEMMRACFLLQLKNCNAYKVCPRKSRESARSIQPPQSFRELCSHARFSPKNDFQHVRHQSLLWAVLPYFWAKPLNHSWSSYNNFEEESVVHSLSPWIDLGHVSYLFLSIPNIYSILLTFRCYVCWIMALIFRTEDSIYILLQLWLEFLQR